MIFVPGPRANRPISSSRWAHAAKGWQDYTKSSSSPWNRSLTREHIFQYDLPLESSTTWDPLLREAQTLLDVVHELHKTAKVMVERSGGTMTSNIVQNASVLLVGHSLGGIMLKQVKVLK